MVRRQEFMDKLLKVKDQRVIKVVSGVRRCGKHCICKENCRYFNQ